MHPNIESSQALNIIILVTIVKIKIVLFLFSDIGTGLNSLLSYSVDSGNGTGLFNVDKDSGKTLIKPSAFNFASIFTISFKHCDTNSM